MLGDIRSFLTLTNKHKEVESSQKNDSFDECRVPQTQIMKTVRGQSGELDSEFEENPVSDALNKVNFVQLMPSPSSLIINPTLKQDTATNKIDKRTKTLSTPKPKRPKNESSIGSIDSKASKLKNTKVAPYFHPKDPRLALLSVADAKMVSKRRLRDPQEDVPYDFELVAPTRGCSIKSLVQDLPCFESMLQSSCLVQLEGNQGWTSTEMLQLCSEASWRRVLIDREKGMGDRNVVADPKPLTLEYICDRLDTDDPIYGYQVRSRSEGWLQGFITYTIFTTWSSYFCFDSRSAACGITADDWEHRVVDRDGELAAALQAQRRWGDPSEEGVVFDKVAEVSLLGGLGCGAWLVCLALEEMRRKGFEWVVLQATDQAIPFYENLGFMRVGCVARHPANATEKEDDLDESKQKKKSQSNGDHSFNPTDGPPIVPKYCSPEDRYYWLALWMIHFVSSWKALDIEAIFAVPVCSEEVPDYHENIVHPPIDLSLMQRRAVGFRYLNLPALVRDLHMLVENAVAFNGSTSYIAGKAKALRSKALAAVRRLVVLEPEVSLASRDMSEVVWSPDTWLFQPTDYSFPKKKEKTLICETVVLSQLEDTSTNLGSAKNKEAENTLQFEEDAHQKWLQTEQGKAFLSRMRNAANQDKNVLGYVHWTFPDQTVEDQYPSYMMARSLLDQPSSATTQTSGDSPELANGYPRGVTPRGDTFVSKFANDRICDYLGTFRSVEQAEAAYLDAKEEAESSEIRGRISQVRDPPPLCTGLLSHLHRWSVLASPDVVPKRMAHSEVAPGRTNLISDQSAPIETEAAMNPSTNLHNLTSVVPRPDSKAKASQVRKSSKEKLYNKIVTVYDQPPCYPYKYWFVYQYVPDMQWCHLCPVQQAGYFTHGKRQGRPRFKLVPEGQAREIDVPVTRCCLVKAQQCVHTSSADQEIFDIEAEGMLLPGN